MNIVIKPKSPRYAILTPALILLATLTLSGRTYAANYPLEIINIVETGANNRIRWAYPGIEYKVRIAAHGGTYPFSWSLAGGTTCTGAAIDAASGEITWANPTVGNSGCSMVVRVVDSEANTDTETFTVTVTNSTTRFIWMDASNNNSGRDGSFANPYRNFIDWYALGSGTHGGKIMYLRSGTYDFTGISGENHRGHGDYAVFFNGAYHPISYIAYPGSAPIISLTRGFSGTNSGKNISWWANNNDLYYYGIRFQSIYAHGFDVDGPDYAVWHGCTFTDANDLDGYYENDAYIFWRNGGTAIKNAILGNTFSNTSGTYISGLKTYVSDHFVIENNTFDDIVDSAINLKDSTHYVSVRGNKFTNSTNAINIASYNTGTTNTEFVYNYFYGPTIWLESEAGVIGQTYFQRNTITNSNIQIRNLATEDGPFVFSNNVIVNTEANSDGDTGDHIYNRHNGPDNRISECHDGGTNCNIVANSASGLVDSNGILLGTWAGNVGKKGWQFASGSTPG